MSQIPQFRGIGEVRARSPIGAVLQIGWRKPSNPNDQNSKWEYAGAFGGSESKGMLRCFNIMTAVTTSTVKRGTHEAQCRTPHPSFASYNTAHPLRCKSIRALLVNSQEVDAYRKRLGAFRAPQGQQGPQKGWWCQGDGVQAQRFVNGEFQTIQCPASMCEWQQEGTGPRGQGAWCKCNLSLIAQFRWKDAPFPEITFQWDSKGWNNASYLDGLFEQINEVGRVLGYDKGTFPVIGLPIVMDLSEKVEPGRKFPIVNISAEGNIFEWAKAAHQLHMAGGRILPPPSAQPKPLELMPPDGFTEQDMDLAREASLSPQYKPANVRE